MARLAPPLRDGGAVLALQATTLNKRRRLVLGVTVHHAACDGSGILRTSAARGRPSASARNNRRRRNQSFIDRTIISDQTGLYDAIYPITLAQEEAKKKPVNNNHDKQRVKDLVAATRGSPRSTSLVAALGLIHHRAMTSTISRNPLNLTVAPVLDSDVFRDSF
ncbi:hypothetical protein PR202_gb16317 [Eleusine coracana subsp. coracana]|uniref:Uncharacterized protein n=1 Tax=Eleusine coracana subsp. coracana TaxID=191504 RepID=A0AAV5F022_ELECO|nr:hypothetical protein PR202_gb16317 [Eleusine coracana subsp. coracana]